MGGSDKASKEAQRAEAQRQAEVARAVSAVNRAYGSPQRAADIADYQAATQELLGQDLARQNAEAQRQTKFALARSGVTGGSFDVDTNRKLAETYQRGVLDVSRKAQGAAAALQAQDQQAKQNLIALAQSGMDATTAAQQASEGIRVNLANARAQDQQQALGDMFKDFGKVWTNSQEQKGKQEAQRYGGGYDALYGRIGGYGE